MIDLLNKTENISKSDNHLTYHSAVPGYNIKEREEPRLCQPTVIAYRDAGTAAGTAVTTLHNTVSATSGTNTQFNLLIGTDFIASTATTKIAKGW